MGSKVRSVERARVPGGVLLTTRSQSNRGTTYILNEIVVLRNSMTKIEFREAIAKGVEALMQSEPELG